MFLYDKDIERVMQAKKREVLHELEVAKKRILEELSEVDKVTLTRFYKMWSEFNEIITRLNMVDENVSQQVTDLRADFLKVLNSHLPEGYVESLVEEYVSTHSGGFASIGSVNTLNDKVETYNLTLTQRVERLEQTLADIERELSEI